MRAVVQRVQHASVDVGGVRVGEVGKGLLVLVAATHGDGETEARQLATKIANLRIFADDEGKMNRSALDLGLSVLVVSQFTLYGDVRRGRRPSFVAAAAPDVAEPLVRLLEDEMRAAGLTVASGRFGAEMSVGLVNDGPVTIWIDTNELRG